MNRIAFLGLGEMGSRMVRNLLKAGHMVTVYNRTPERAVPLTAEGAIPASSPMEAATGAEIVISMVTDVEASRAIWLDEQIGAIHAIHPGMIAIESSTVTPKWTRQLGEEISRRGAGFLDAPVAGSLPQAEGGELIYLVGGSKDVVDKATVALRTMGSGIHHVGEIGAGTGMKLAVNALLAIEAAALGEALGMIARLGIDQNHAIEVLSSNPVMSPRMRLMAGQMAAKSFAPNFPIHLVAKDLRYIVETAGGVDAASPVSAAVRDLYAQAEGKGLGENDISGIAQMFE